MKKKKYLKRLRYALRNAPRSDREQYLDYYSELIDDAVESGRRERDVIAELDSPEAVAEKWLAERAGSAYVPPVVPVAPVRESRRRNAGGGGGTAVKAIFSPLILLVGLLACIIGFVCIIVFSVLIISFFAAALGIGVGGVFTIVMSFGLFAGNISLAVLQIGVGIALCGVAALLEVFVILLAKSYGAMWRFIFHRGRSERRSRSRGKSALTTCVIGVVLLVVGGVIGTVFYGTLGFDHMRLAAVGEVSEETLDVSLDGVETFTLDAGDLTVTLKKSEDGAAKFVYTKLEKCEVAVNYESGVLSVDNGEDGGIVSSRLSEAWHYGIFYSAMKPYYYGATLYLPEDYAGGLKISVKNGSVTLEDFSLGNVEIEAKNGAVKVEKGTYGTLNLTAQNGAVSVEEIAVGELSVEAHNGAIRLTEITGNKVKAITHNGLVKLDRIVGEDIYLESYNGAVHGSIVGAREDFAIDAHTDNGSNNLASKLDGDKLLYAHTHNGAIKIQFVS
ncbi:MAG: DUF4097 family beta strand repeat-containing protein [Clostridiales bacterium]|nr:DUF4097 family beta strand repeat-containing protein [Clostridiales bacterium]